MKPMKRLSCADSTGMERKPSVISLASTLTHATTGADNTTSDTAAYTQGAVQAASLFIIAHLTLPLCPWMSTRLRLRSSARKCCP